MSMATLNVIQLLQLFIGYIAFTVGLPALVLYRKVKNFSAPERFAIYFTVGNFYIINLVQILELLHISNRVTLSVFTFIPAFLLIVKFYNIHVISYLKKVSGEFLHYAAREIGLKSLLRHRWQEMKVFIRRVLRHTLRLVKENYQVFPFIVLFTLLVWLICGNGILKNFGFGASDLPVHNYWINGLYDNNIYINGIYPMGMHCMLYYLSVMFAMPAYVALRLFWYVQYSVISAMIFVFLRGVCKNKFLPYLGALMFVGAKFFVSASYLRFGSTLPQEYGMLYILPSILFAVKFFQERERELENGYNLIKCRSTFYLLCFALSFSMTLSSHFYDTMVAGIMCIGVAVGFGYRFFRKEYFWRVMLFGVISILLAFLPMAAAALTGKSPQGSMYWAMNVIGLRDYTVLIFRIICTAVIVLTAGGIILIISGIKRGKISFENKKVPVYSKLHKILIGVFATLPLLAVLFIGMIYRKQITSGIEVNSFSVPLKNFVFIGFVFSIIIGVILIFIDNNRGSALISAVSAEILLGFVLVSGSLGFPMLMEPYRVCIYCSYLIPVIAVMALDGAVSLIFLCRFPKIQQVVGLILSLSVIVCAQIFDFIKRPFGGGSLEMNEAILCTTNILNDNMGKSNKWTIVSCNDELRMIEKYGRHTETIEFLEDMENWNRMKEVTIPTDIVYFYIEKKPLNYANGYGGIIPEVSKEQARQSLPENSGLFAYNGPRRSVTMSRMYYWAQKFMELYPNEFKVYFENDRFVCYYIEQNVYSLYNFAIDYGYN